MFGFGKSKPEQDDKNQQEIERLKKTINQYLLQMKTASPESAASLSDQLKNFCQNEKLIPFDFKKTALALCRQLECESNMRVADKLIRQAASMIKKEEIRERGQKLAESRRYFSKVCSLGAEPQWKRAYQRLAETVMMSGGVSLEGASRAKPIDRAPKAPNRAKM
jgi:hypothetical protein